MGENTVTFEVRCHGFVPDQSWEDDFRRKLLSLMAARYRAFLFRRFNINSRGGGDWPPLKESTKSRRRKGKPIHRTNPEQVAIESIFQKKSILVDTGILRSALNVRPAAASFEEISISELHASVAVGFSQMIHPPPTKKPKSKRVPKIRTPITVTQLAYIHHFGCKKRGLPARPILVPPDEACMKAMEILIESEMKKIHGLDGN